MKVFIFEKNAMQDDKKENETTLLLKDENKFNSIIITNPYDSNFLCIINSIILRLDECNYSMILPIEQENIKCSDSRTIEETHIYEQRVKCDNYLSKYIMTEDKMELLEGKYAILIPNGALCIKLYEPVIKATFKIKWVKELM